MANVLPLSKTHHAAFDREVFTIDQDYRLWVNPSFEIIQPDEKSFVGGKEGGVFIGLKTEMIERDEAYVDTCRD